MLYCLGQVALASVEVRSCTLDLPEGTECVPALWALQSVSTDPNRGVRNLSLRSREISPNLSPREMTFPGRQVSDLQSSAWPYGMVEVTAVPG